MRDDDHPVSTAVRSVRYSYSTKYDHVNDKTLHVTIHVCYMYICIHTLPWYTSRVEFLLAGRTILRNERIVPFTVSYYYRIVPCRTYIPYEMTPAAVTYRIRVTVVVCTTVYGTGTVLVGPYLPAR